MTKPMTIVHFDISGPDAPVLHAFYRSLCGWKIQDRGPGYAQIATPQGSPDGAITEAESPGLTIGLQVADLDATLIQVQALGGRIAMPALDNGWVRKATVLDPAGNCLTLIQA